jgi:hypothetical protein
MVGCGEYNREEEIMYVPKSKFNLTQDAPDYMHDFATQLRNELKQVGIATAKTSGTTVIISGTSSSGGSSGGGTTTNNVKSGVQSVTAGTSAWVPFPQTFSVTPIVTLVFISGTDGSFGSINTSNLSIQPNGFTINSADILVSGVIFYIATVNG